MKSKSLSINLPASIADTREAAADGRFTSDNVGKVAAIPANVGSAKLTKLFPAHA
jgi:hypothetical protein